MNTLVTQSLSLEDVHLLFNFPRQLMTDTEQKYVDWITNYTSKYGKPPQLTRFCDEFDTFVPVTSKDPLGDIYDQTLVEKRNHYTREYLTSIQMHLKAGADPLPYIDQLHQVIRGGSGDVTRYTKFDRTSFYRKPSSFPYEISQIDRYTGGISAGDLIYLIGRLGTGKTTFALYVMTKSLQRGRKVLMVSNENRAEDVVAKVDAYMGGFNPLHKRTMQWSEDDLHRLSTVSYIASKMDGEMFIPNHPVQDVKELRSLIYTYRPDIILVDGIYLMQGQSGDSHWEKITNVSRSLKQLAEGEGVPILGVHQANRNAIGKRIEIEHIAYADALAQDADLVLAINPEDDGRLFVEAIKNRWGSDKWGFFLQVHFDTMSVRIFDKPVSASDDDEEVS